MNKTVKTIVEIALFLLCCFLVYLIYSSVMEPVRFNKEQAKRTAVAVQRLKDIRTLQVAYKGENGKFTSTIDSLKNFYENGKMTIVMQVGSADDSLSVVHTEAVKKANKKITPQQLFEMYKAGDDKLVFSIESKINVKDTLFNNRPDFCIDSLKYIPFSGGELVEMEAETRTVSGVQVPLFEARMPFKKLLKGMDEQLRINQDCERRDQGRYEGLQVGSITTPNNNAGNWE
ncbi:MAG: hypothetical protein MJY73_05370 [Bacteroidales bacterium]|nr:hypothetical protein [Bacteroidales bacterium]